MLRHATVSFQTLWILCFLCGFAHLTFFSGPAGNSAMAILNRAYTRQDHKAVTEGISYEEQAREVYEVLIIPRLKKYLYVQIRNIPGSMFALQH